MAMSTKTATFVAMKKRILLCLMIACVSASIRATDAERFFSRLEQAVHDDAPNLYSAVTAQPLDTLMLDASPSIESRALYWKALILSKSAADSAATLLNRSFSLTDSVALPYHYARLRMLQADLMRQNGKWGDAYVIYRGLEQYFHSCRDTFWEAKTIVAIGTIMQVLEKHDDAIECFAKAGSLFEQCGSNNCKVKNLINICNILYLKGEKTKALTTLRQLRDNPVTRSDTTYMINVLISLSHVSDYSEPGCARVAYNLAKSRDNPFLITLSLLYLGIEEENNNARDSALVHYKLALKSARMTDDVYHASQIYQCLSDAYLTIGLNDSSDHYYRLYRTWEDSLFSRNRVTEINKMEHRSTVERYEYNMRQLEASNRYHTRLTTIIVTAVVIIALMVCVILYLSRRRIQMKHQLREAQNRELRDEIEAKNREIASNTLIITQNNATLKELKAEIERFEHIGAIASPDSEQLKGRIKMQLATDDEWQYFKLRFEKVHPGFLAALTDMAPSLTPTELRLCSYIRVGMSVKEIAKALSVLPSSVNTSRYRLRKKLRIAPEESLDAFLMSLHPRRDN